VAVPEAVPSCGTRSSFLLREGRPTGSPTQRLIDPRCLPGEVVTFGEVGGGPGGIGMVPTRSALASPTTTTALAPGVVTTTTGPPAADDCTQKSYPCLSPPIYSADLVFPIVKLDQRDNWRPNGSRLYRAMVPSLVFLGWALTTFVVAGFSSLVRRE